MDMEEQPGSISSMKKTVERNEKIINEADQWTPELQMRIEQTHVLKIMIEALKDVD